MLNKEATGTAHTNGTSAGKSDQNPWHYSGRRRYVSVAIIIILFAIGSIRALTGSSGFVTTEINDQYLGVNGTYGAPVFWELSSITDIQFTESFDFGTCIEGDSTDNTVSGTYSNDTYEEYTVHAYSKKPCIILHSQDEVLVFNCSTTSNTKKMYNELLQATGLN